MVAQLQQQQSMHKDDEEKSASCSTVEKSIDDVQIVEEVVEVDKVRHPKKKGISPPRQLAKLNAHNLPRSLKHLVSYARLALNDGQSIPCNIDVNVFGHDVNSYIFIEDVGSMCEKKSITVSCICVYCWHLYKEGEQMNLLHRIRFADPNPLSITVKPNQRGETMGRSNHWILLVVDPHAETVYVLDSLLNPSHVGVWKGIMQTALRMFDNSISRRGRSLLWEPIKPPGEECGFYVMRYMKYIVDNLASSSPIPIKDLFFEAPYMTTEIDEVRSAWAELVYDMIWS